VGNNAEAGFTRRSVTDHDRLLVRQSLRLPIILTLGSYPVVTRVFINIVDLGCPQKGQSIDALTRWPDVGRKRGVAGNVGFITSALIPLLT
jgi:hypothetical protein